MIEDGTIIRRKPDLITADSGGDSIVLNSTTGMFYQLNPTAARMWDMVETPQTLAALVERTTETFDVTAQACRDDLAVLIADMRERGLVETV